MTHRRWKQSWADTNKQQKRLALPDTQINDDNHFLLITFPWSKHGHRWQLIWWTKGWSKNFQKTSNITRRSKNSKYPPQSPNFTGLLKLNHLLVSHQGIVSIKKALRLGKQWQFVFHQSQLNVKVLTMMNAVEFRAEPFRKSILAVGGWWQAKYYNININN